MLPLVESLLLGGFLFSMGMVLIIVKRNAIMVLIGIELLLNAANLNLIVFSQYDANIGGQVFALFVVVVAAAEAAVGLAIVVQAYQYFGTADIDRLKDLKN